MNESKNKSKNKSQPVTLSGSYRHHSLGVTPMGLRTRVMRHIAGFAVLFAFFIFSGVYESGKGGTLSDWTVIFYVFFALIAYALGFYTYPIIHRAWLDSKQ